MELLDVYDENLIIKSIAERDDVHKYGLLHKVVHCWIISKRNNKTGIYFQQRSFTKKDFPGYFDVAVGGHIDSGEETKTAVLREMYEELGIKIDISKLFYLGQIIKHFKSQTFDDNEIAKVYVLCCDNIIFKPGPEVCKMVFISIDELMKDDAQISGFDDSNKIAIPKEKCCWCEDELKNMVLPYINNEI